MSLNPQSTIFYATKRSIYIVQTSNKNSPVIWSNLSSIVFLFDCLFTQELLIAGLFAIFCIVNNDEHFIYRYVDLLTENLIKHFNLTFWHFSFHSQQSKKTQHNYEWDLFRPSVSNWRLQSVSLSTSSTEFENCMFGWNALNSVSDHRYGYLTNTRVKFILVTTDQDVRDADVRSVSNA